MKVRFEIDDGFVMFYDADSSQFYDEQTEIYHVDTRRISCAADLVQKSYHIGSKQWMSKENVLTMIDLICEVKGWNPHAIPV
jgi:hypothetical protein